MDIRWDKDKSIIIQVYSWGFTIFFEWIRFKTIYMILNIPLSLSSDWKSFENLYSYDKILPKLILSKIGHVE